MNYSNSSYRLSYLLLCAATLCLDFVDFIFTLLSCSFGTINFQMAKKKIAPAVSPVSAKAVNEPVKTQPTAGHEPKAFAEHWYIIILLALAFLINAPTISYDYTLDDPFFTKENPLVREGMASIPEFFQHDFIQFFSL